MGLGKTFTHSIARDIGRNYGKAASNSLLGDKHSTPIRIVGGSQKAMNKMAVFIKEFTTQQIAKY